VRLLHQRIEVSTEARIRSERESSEIADVQSTAPRWALSANVEAGQARATKTPVDVRYTVHQDRTATDEPKAIRAVGETELIQASATIRRKEVDPQGVGVRPCVAERKADAEHQATCAAHRCIRTRRSERGKTQDACSGGGLQHPFEHQLNLLEESETLVLMDQFVG
jgi:hypothetical protein